MQAQEELLVELQQKLGNKLSREVGSSGQEGGAAFSASLGGYGDVCLSCPRYSSPALKGLLSREIKRLSRRNWKLQRLS